jgi:hypothetical protein
MILSGIYVTMTLDKIIRELSIQDTQLVYDIQKCYKYLDYSVKDVQLLLSTFDSINLTLNDVTICLGYPAYLWSYINIATNQRYNVKEYYRAENTNDAFYIELKATRPDCIGLGYYKELMSYYEKMIPFGYKKILLDSIEPAYKIHLKEGFKLIRKVPDMWSNKDISIDSYFMCKDIT